ncbi:VOC family protein [Cytobacillus sp. FJAT-54145]|uniref:VOC family protein n=1 Tax=Cytobacillus spartinae TaxID=3299023 RepID=A0ABW6K587_9BACI
MHFHRSPHVYVEKVVIKVLDLERSLSFYKNVIGFKVLQQSANKVSLTADGENALLVIEQPEEIHGKQPRTTGLYHFALLLPSRSDLANMLQHFIQLQYPLQGASDHLVSEAIYLADPDGNGIEVYVDRPSSTWNWQNGNVEMATKPIDIEGLLAEGSGSWSKLPTDTLMGHIHLHVSNLKETEDFYCKGLGFDIVARYGSQALFISTGGYHHHIGLNTWNGIGAPAPDENSVGLKYFTLLFSSEESREKIVNQLQGIGVSISEENNRYVVHDPSGNSIHLVI